MSGPQALLPPPLLFGHEVTEDSLQDGKEEEAVKDQYLYSPRTG